MTPEETETTPTETNTPTPTTTTSVEPTGTSRGHYVSKDGQCGATSDQTCIGSSFGECCGSSGECSTSILSCISILGCQEDYGNCI